MRNIFVISDTHFSHNNVLTFKGKDGTLIRPLFQNVEEMDEIIINNWNAIIKPTDIVYHLGDVAFGGKNTLSRIMPRLTGHKRLILGNHDSDDMTLLTPHFEKIMSWRKFTKEFKRKILLCHYPLHTSAFRYTANENSLCVHGHIHEKVVGDPIYVNVCVERTGYKPVAIEDIVDGIFK